MHFLAFWIFALLSTHAYADARCAKRDGPGIQDFCSKLILDVSQIVATRSPGISGWTIKSPVSSIALMADEGWLALSDLTIDANGVLTISGNTAGVHTLRWGAEVALPPHDYNSFVLRLSKEGAARIQFFEHDTLTGNRLFIDSFGALFFATYVRDERQNTWEGLRIMQLGKDLTVVRSVQIKQSWQDRFPPHEIGALKIVGERAILGLGCGSYYNRECEYSEYPFAAPRR